MRTDSERTAVSEGTRHAGVQNERCHVCKIQRQAKLIHGAGGRVVVPVSPGPMIPIWVLVTRGRGGLLCEIHRTTPLGSACTLYRN